MFCTEACDAEMAVVALAGEAITTPARDSAPPITTRAATLATDFRMSAMVTPKGIEGDKRCLWTE